MKKILMVAAAAGLMTLAACNKADTGNSTVDNMIDQQEANAAMYENQADMAANEATESAFENAADAADNAADAMADNATTNEM